MRNECNIIRDLLPLYAEDMVTADTAAFVEEHLKSCEACREEYRKARQPRPARESPAPAPLVKLSRMLRAKRLQTIALTVLFALALFTSAFAVLEAPIYLPYTENLITPEAMGDKGLLLTFDSAVSSFACTVYEDPEGGAFYYCDIQAWTTLLDKFSPQKRGKMSHTVTTAHAEPILAVYTPNDGTEDVCLARYDPAAPNRIEKKPAFESRITLPRLALGYYLALAAIALAAAVIAWLFVRKKPTARLWVERAGLYPVSYIISHGVVSGIGWASYSLPRDLSLIVFISILLYGGLLLAHNVWRLKRMIEPRDPQGQEPIP